MSRTDKDIPFRLRAERGETLNEYTRNYMKTARSLKRLGAKNRRHGKVKFIDIQTVRSWKFHY